MCIGIYALPSSLYGSSSCFAAFLHIYAIIDLRHCQLCSVYIKNVYMFIYYMFRFALFHAVDSIIICIMNVCLKKPVQLPFENRLAFQANTHTHTYRETDRHTARRTRETETKHISNLC